MAFDNDNVVSLRTRPAGEEGFCRRASKTLQGIVFLRNGGSRSPVSRSYYLRGAPGLLCFHFLLASGQSLFFFILCIFTPTFLYHVYSCFTISSPVVPILLSALRSPCLVQSHQLVDGIWLGGL